MKQVRFLLISISVVLISCNSSNNLTDNSEQKDTSKIKFTTFNNVNDVLDKLSTNGIGQLGNWKDDQMGGYMSITPYYQFGFGNRPNNLAYYLQSNNPNSIKTLTLTLNINNSNKRSALFKFAEVVNFTYKSLGLKPTPQIIYSAKSGKEAIVEKQTHSERIKLEKSRIETWNFIVETK